MRFVYPDASKEKIKAITLKNFENLKLKKLQNLYKVIKIVIKR